MIETLSDFSNISNQVTLFKKASAIRNQLSFNLDEKEMLPQIRDFIASPISRRFCTLSDDQIYNLALYDTRTNAYTFRYFARELNREIKRCLLYERQLSVLMFCIDKPFDLYTAHGCVAYEAVIMASFEILLNFCRSELDSDLEIICRYDDYAFFVMLPETNSDEAQLLSSKIREVFRSISIAYNAQILNVKGNVGLACFPADGDDVESLLAAADLSADRLF